MHVTLSLKNRAWSIACMHRSGGEARARAQLFVRDGVTPVGVGVFLLPVACVATHLRALRLPTLCAVPEETYLQLHPASGGIPIIAPLSTETILARLDLLLLTVTLASP